ncbi:MAG: exonuclease SbcCD subunit D C-terminal domain-containing protein [Candidatus Competibacteraceae bacterium]|nr:exonuclease SbcCD subunit D C-terminal domain-containing protein [Candidatus Competibacteraceae bacterium]
MRLLHTADWHLGQSLHTFERGYEHQRFLDWLLDTMDTERIDALLVAGDIFDNANPSAAAQRQFYRFLAAAKRRLPRLDIAIIAGNHDSAGRLEAPAPLFEAFDAAVVGHTTRDGDGAIEFERFITPLRDRAGDIAVWCLAVPFLRPGDVPRVETDGDPYLKGIEALYQRTLERALKRQENGQAVVALGHCHMRGGQLSEDSERRIVIGGIEALPVETFDPAISYAALGHLHRAQQVGGQERVRYSGSPLPMSFAEVGYPHQVIRVDLDNGSLVDTKTIRVPRFVDLLRIPAQPAPLNEVLDALAALDLPDDPLEARPYLEARVRLDAPEPGLRARIEAALEDKPVRLARIETSYRRAVEPDFADIPQSMDELSRLRPDEIFGKLHWRKYGSEPAPELLAAFRELLLAPETGGPS